MNKDVMDFVWVYYHQNFSVKESLTILNIKFGGGFTWDQVADMYMQLECEEEGK